MSDDQNEDEERPCLHCLIIDVIDSFFAEYPVSSEEPDAIDTDEVVTAIAKTVAELTYGQDAAGRQAMIEQLMREIMNYDAEYRQQDEMGRPGSAARHYVAVQKSASFCSVSVGYLPKRPCWLTRAPIQVW